MSEIPAVSVVPASPAPAVMLRVPNLYAVASGKGGVGKTWFSITLCQALAARQHKVLLFDGDLGLANIDIQLGLTPEHDLSAVMDGKVTLAGAVTRYSAGRFDILAGRSGSGNLATLPTQRLNELRSGLIELSKNYTHAVIDLGAGVDRATRHMAGPAAISFIIVNDEPTSLTDAYAFIKLSRQANPQADLRVVVNMASNAAEGMRTYETLRKACETFLSYTPPLAGIIRRDPKVREAIRAQTPLLTRSPEADAAVDIAALLAKNFPA
jgi:flagellar biosynthesis protein FlhG